jgi:hypothetical protein
VKCKASMVKALKRLKQERPNELQNLVHVISLMRCAPGRSLTCTSLARSQPSASVPPQPSPWSSRSSTSRGDVLHQVQETGGGHIVHRRLHEGLPLQIA